MIIFLKNVIYCLPWVASEVFIEGGHWISSDTERERKKKHKSKTWQQDMGLCGFLFVFVQRLRILTRCVIIYSYFEGCLLPKWNGLKHWVSFRMQWISVCTTSLWNDRQGNFVDNPVRKKTICYLRIISSIFIYCVV